MSLGSLEKYRRIAEWPLMILAIVFLIAYAVPIIDPNLSSVKLFEIVVWATWAAFAVDYIVRLVLAKGRWRFIRSHPLELASVVLPMLRPLRILRLLLILQFFQSRGNSLRIKAGTYTAGGASLLIFIGGLAITEAERGAPDALIASVMDGWWWAFVSMTTVGYGDLYPVTMQGKLVAVALMFAGIAVLGTIIGMVSSWIVEQVKVVEVESIENGSQIDSTDKVPIHT